jgi:putative ABC transport system permease protein
LITAFPNHEHPVVRGRNFSRNFPVTFRGSGGERGVSAPVRAQRRAVGETVRFGDRANPNSLEIVGVIADFHQSSLHHPIEAQVFLLAAVSPHVVVKVGGDLPAPWRTWSDMAESPARRALPLPFLDEELQDGYRADQVRGRVFLAFSLVTLGISFLGLFGLAAYLAGQRTREVGIRKVLGGGTATWCCS